MGEEMKNNNYLREDYFIYKGTKLFLQDYKDKFIDYNLEGNTNENLIIRRFLESKKYEIKFINRKRNELKSKICNTENTIKNLENSFVELDKEREARLVSILKERNKNTDLESLEDIEEAVSEIKKIKDYELKKLKKLKKQIKDFDESSKEEEKLISTLLNYIKKEFLEEKDYIVKLINSGTLKDVELILNYEYLSIIIDGMLNIEEEILGG